MLLLFYIFVATRLSEQVLDKCLKRPNAKQKTATYWKVFNIFFPISTRVLSKKYCISFMSGKQVQCCYLVLFFCISVNRVVFLDKSSPKLIDDCNNTKKSKRNYFLTVWYYCWSVFCLLKNYCCFYYLHESYYSIASLLGYDSHKVADKIPNVS